MPAAVWTPKTAVTPAKAGMPHFFFRNSRKTVQMATFV
jgi:hypothetical protein